jgi:pyruvate kinase
MKRKISIICTLGPSSLNKKFMKLAEGNISLFRLNMSHLSLFNLKKSILKIRRYSKIPICIDTEGAQIRTKVKKERFYKKNQKIVVYKKNKSISLYPPEVFEKIKVRDILNFGFENLRAKVLRKDASKLVCHTISEGFLGTNKGVHLENRKINLMYLTNKDFKAIKIGNEFKINNYALSFTNSVKDMKKFNKLLKDKNKIFKIETKDAVKDFKNILKYGNKFLIDRGDLSKDIKIENIPYVQRKLFALKNKYKKKIIYVATNLLESMMTNSYPTRGEANDIFNCLEMGANGLVLAAETATGKYPIEAIVFLKKMIKTFNK